MEKASGQEALSYDATFYGEIAGGSHRSATIVLPIVFRTFVNGGGPTSVVDVGCGVGTWLRAASELGVTDVQGIDGDHVPMHLLEIDPCQFTQRDLRQATPTPTRRFDLALSLEVAEHLPHDRAGAFVAELCALADVVLFSAAIPGQGGQDHINEEWPTVWAARFAIHGYSTFDVVRPAVWGNEHVEYWYKQNALLYIADERTDLVGAASKMIGSANQAPLNLVHPIAWTRLSRSWNAATRSQPGVRLAASRLASAVRVAVTTRWSGARRG